MGTKMVFSTLMVVILFTLLLNSDDIEKMKPQDILNKASKNSLAKKGFCYNYESENDQQKYSLTGVFKSPDLFSFTGAVEGFKKGKKIAVKDTDGKWTTSNKIKNRPEVDLMNIFNPQNFLRDVSKSTAKNIKETEEKVGDVSCKVIETIGKSEKIKEYASNIRELVKRNTMTDIDFSRYVNYKKSSVTYEVYVGKEDFLIYCIKQKVEIKMKEKPPEIGGFTVPKEFTYTDVITYSSYEQEPNLEIPREAKKILGIK